MFTQSFLWAASFLSLFTSDRPLPVLSSHTLLLDDAAYLYTQTAKTIAEEEMFYLLEDFKPRESLLINREDSN